MSIIQSKYYRFFFFFTIFFYGCATLILEILASRILSPYFGNTIYSYSGIITVVLFGLSIGYFLSGFIADKYASLKLYFGLFFISAFTVLAVKLLYIYILPLISYGLSFTFGPIIVSTLVFFIPSVIFGMLSPISLVLTKNIYIKKGLAKPASIIFFLSTIGSIVGSLLTSFVLVPFFGVSLILTLLFGVLLIIATLGTLPYLRITNRLLMIVADALLICLVANIKPFNQYSLFQQDGLYELITIYDSVLYDKKVRILKQDRSVSGVVYADSNEIVPNSLKYYRLYQQLNLEPKRILIIGGGAYLVPQDILNKHPNAVVDVIEIEPSLINLADEYFGFQKNNMINNHITDARRFLKSTNYTYDLIISDAYQSYFSIPVQYTTVEFFGEILNHLNKNGLFIINVVDSLENKNNSFVFSEIRTFKQVFPNSYFFAVASPENQIIQNIIFLGINNNNEYQFGDTLITGTNISPKKQLIDLSQYDLQSHPIFSDDYSPVEYYMGETLKNSGVRKPLYPYGPLPLL